MNRAEKAALQLQAVSVLRTLKETRTYDELAAETGLPAGDLNRYVNGHVLPSADRAREVVTEIGESALRDELDARVTRDDEGYVDNSGVVFDQSFLVLSPTTGRTSSSPLRQTASRSPPASPPTSTPAARTRRSPRRPPSSTSLRPASDSLAASNSPTTSPPRR